jgi:hypothetical protein
MAWLDADLQIQIMSGRQAHPGARQAGLQANHLSKGISEAGFW